VVKDKKDVFEKKLETGNWPIFVNTRNRHSLRPGDDVVFYMAGDLGRNFVGISKISSRLIIIKDKIDNYVEIGCTKVWKKPKSIEDLLSELKFIKNKSYWGIHMQGGVIKISRSDFDKILEA